MYVYGTHAQVRAHVRALVHVYVDAFLPAHTHVHTAHMRAHVHIAYMCRHARMKICTQARSHTHARMCARTRARGCTRTAHAFQHTCNANVSDDCVLALVVVSFEWAVACSIFLCPVSVRRGPAVPITAIRNSVTVW